MVGNTQIQNLTASGSVTIAQSSNTSTGINTSGLKLAAVVIPATMDSGKITFEGSFDGGSTFTSLFDINGMPYVTKITPGSAVMMTPLDFAGADIVRFKGDRTESAERIINVIMRP